MTAQMKRSSQDLPSALQPAQMLEAQEQLLRSGTQGKQLGSTQKKLASSHSPRDRRQHLAQGPASSSSQQ